MLEPVAMLLPEDIVELPPISISGGDKESVSCERKVSQHGLCVFEEVDVGARKVVNVGKVKRTK